MRTTQNSVQLPRRSAISGIVIMLIIVGVGAGMAFAALAGIQDNLGGLTGSNKVIITSLNAYTAGDRMVISGNVQNIGSQPLTSITIDEITAGDLVITQNPAIDDGQVIPDHGRLTLTGLQHDGAIISFTGSGVFAAAGNEADVDTTPTAAAVATPDHVWDNAAVTATTGTTDTFYFVGATATGGAIVKVSGLSTDDDTLEPLTAGSSKAFRITITGESSGVVDGLLDILRTVPASTELFMTVTGTDGSTSTISDPRSTRVSAR